MDRRAQLSTERMPEAWDDQRAAALPAPRFGYAFAGYFGYFAYFKAFSAALHAEPGPAT